jgi:hypothetical protein
MSGPTGPTGITGAYGLQGFRGLRGLPYGPTGPPYRGAGTRLTIQSPTGTSITLTESSLYTYYNIASQATTTIVFPTRSESYPTPEQTGAFWVFRNNTPSTTTLAFSNGTVDCAGVAATTSVDIPKGNGLTVAYASNITGYVAF